VEKTSQIIVIGAGIIGINCAIALQKRGRRVVIVDRESETPGASYGNAGAFAFSDIMPLAAPGVMRKAPKWLLDPLGPLSIPPRYALQIAPWMLRFWRASWRDRVEASTAAQTALMDFSRDSLISAIKAADAGHLLRHEGQLQLYQSAAEFNTSLPGWQARARHGIPFRHLKSAEEIATVQPGISPEFCAASFTPEWYNIVDPAVYMQHLITLFRQAGGEIRRAKITTLAQTDTGVTLTTATGQVLRSDNVVVACGAWSRDLARSLGDNIPLETERGYNTTLPAGAFDLRTHLTFGGHGFVVTRIGDGIRIGGAVELGGLNLPPNYKRARVLLDKARRFLPGLKATGGQQWMGFRPSLPDSLPVIGRSPGHSRITYAFGHGHLGLTQSSGTGELVADLVTQRPTAIDVTAFRPNRF
jgi:glycine/D-amino acid oxidase-like deaminating enzyme